jgi:hypothetical protein
MILLNHFFIAFNFLHYRDIDFFSYMLCNPKITSWQHDNMAQSENGGQVENKLSVVYDAVIYNSGVIKTDNPSGFAVLHYDNVPSPIGNSFIIQDGIDGIFGDVFSRNVFAGPTTFLNRIRNTLQQYVNLGNRGQFGATIPPLFFLTNSSFDSVGGLGDIKIAKFSGDEPIFDEITFAGEGIAKPSNGTGGILREDLPPIERNRTDATQQDWNDINQFNGSLPLPPPPTPGTELPFPPPPTPTPPTTDVWNPTFPTNREQAQENRIAQGTSPVLAPGEAFSAITSGFEAAERRRQIESSLPFPAPQTPGTQPSGPIPLETPAILPPLLPGPPPATPIAPGTAASAIRAGFLEAERRRQLQQQISNRIPDDF